MTVTIVGACLPTGLLRFASLWQAAVRAARGRSASPWRKLGRTSATACCGARVFSAGVMTRRCARCVSRCPSRRSRRRGLGRGAQTAWRWQVVAQSSQATRRKLCYIAAVAEEANTEADTVAARPLPAARRVPCAVAGRAPAGSTQMACACPSSHARALRCLPTQDPRAQWLKGRLLDSAGDMAQEMARRLVEEAMEFAVAELGGEDGRGFELEYEYER